MVREGMFEATPVEADPPPGFWQRDAVYHPEPVMPMWRSVYMVPISAGFRDALAELSSMAEEREYRDIGGWGYFRANGIGAKDHRFPGRVAGCLESIRNYRELDVLRCWESEWKPAQERQIGQLLSVDLSALTDMGLVGHMSSVLLPFLTESLKRQAFLELTFLWAMARFASLCQELLHLRDGEILALLSGLSKETTESTRRLSALANIAARRDETRRLLEEPDETTDEKLAAEDEEFAAALRSYLRNHGCRVLHHAIHYPTLREKPQVVLGLIRDQLLRAFDQHSVDAELAQKRAVAVSHARATLAGHQAVDRERFEKALESAELVYPVKEGGEYATFEAPMALMRYALLELGSRFVHRGSLETRDEVFFLELEEALRAFQDSRDLRKLIARRKAERAWATAHPGPPSYGQDPGRPSDVLPQELQLLTKGIFWVLSQYYGMGTIQEPVPFELHGMAASPGTYTGPARVIMNESEFGKLQAGDVLVCRITSPSWAMLFPSIGAIITDVGGILSHPAIIAREYRVPAVVATKNATGLLRDGQIVTVDGSAGTIKMG